MGNFTADKMFTKFCSCNYANITILTEKLTIKFLYKPWYERYSETKGWKKYTRILMLTSCIKGIFSTSSLDSYVLITMYIFPS